jgi:thiol-disulfide isomerase/thioredoxin
MSTGENPQLTQIEAPHWCPKCGAALNDGAKAEVAPGSPSCEACGMPLGRVPVETEGAEAAGFPMQGAARPRKNRNPLALVAAAVVIAGMLYAGFHFARRGENADQVMKNRPAPDFTLQALDGKTMRLSDWRGKAVLLNFWATWCGPCKIETPWLVELQNQYGSQGLQIVGVAMDDSGKDEIARFAKEMGMNYPVLLGKEAVGDAYGGVPYLPETFFIGRDGKIVAKIMGIDSRSAIEEGIKKALNTRAAVADATSGSAAFEAKK